MNGTRIVQWLPGRSGKTTARWIGVKAYCEANPGKIGALVTPSGTFTVVFKPKETAP